MQMIFAIVAFSTVVDYDGLSRIKYVMFTGITGFILALFFMVAYAVGIGAVSTHAPTCHRLSPGQPTHAGCTCRHSPSHLPGCCMEASPGRGERCGLCRRWPGPRPVRLKPLCLPPLAGPPAGACASRKLHFIRCVHNPPRPWQARGIIAFVLDAIWAIFWLAAAGCASSVLTDYSDFATSKLKASVA